MARLNIYQKRELCKTSWRDKEITDRQKAVIEYIEFHCTPWNVKFDGITRGEASDFIDKYLDDAVDFDRIVLEGTHPNLFGLI